MMASPSLWPEVFLFFSEHKLEIMRLFSRKRKKGKEKQNQEPATVRTTHCELFVRSKARSGFWFYSGRSGLRCLDEGCFMQGGDLSSEHNVLPGHLKTHTLHEYVDSSTV